MVISDLLMPVMDGYILLRRWKADARFQAIPFVVYTDTQDEDLARNMGADAFILKTIEPASLMAHIRDVLDRAKHGGLSTSTTPADDTKFFLKNYSNTLVRKLEAKMLELEQRNRELEADIAARQQAEAALRESEKEFHSLAESMPQIVWACDSDGLNIYFNQQWVDYTGMSLAESHGTGWNKPFHPDDQQRAWDAWQNTTHNQGTYSLECRLRRFDGVYRWWLIRGVPQRGGASAQQRLLRRRRFGSLAPRQTKSTPLLGRSGISAYRRQH
jgi:PAS domain S-box-containing protein